MLTDPGRVRHGNQDACAAAPDHAAFVVCDGVGGAAGGEVASQLAAETFLAALRSSALNEGVAHSHVASSRVSGEDNDGVPHSYAVPLAGTRTGGEENSSHPHARLHHAVTAANNAVFQRAQKVRTLRGMATTLVAALLEYPASNAGVPHSYAGESTRMSGEDESLGAPSKLRLGGSPACPTLWLAHTGDSRAYLFRAKAGGQGATLRQLTCDHSLVEEQIRAGLLSRHDALRSPVRNVITRAVGAAPSVEPEIAAHEIQPGDLYLLASDGLTRELTDPAIARILAASLGSNDATADATPPELRMAHSRAASPRVSGEEQNSSTPYSAASLEAAAQALIDAANQHGGRDNITVLLLACK
jgi:serine/threonine protein phosphatase PrpC